MTVQIIQKNSFEIIKKAVNEVVNLIRPTFGPASNKVIISKVLTRGVVDDGVQIARDLEFEDAPQNAVLNVVRETAIRTNDRVGDGTTGALIMLQAIINEVAKRDRFDGRKIELELKKALIVVKEKLKQSTTQIKTKEELEKVARISFDNPEIAGMIASAYYKMGKDGVITVDNSPAMKTTIEVTDGIKLDRGYLTPYMINNPQRMEGVIDKPYVLLTDYRITENSDIMPLMEKMIKVGKNRLIVIADNVEQDALATLAINQTHVINPQTGKPGIFQSIAISIPSVEDKKVLLEDLAILTGARVFSESKGDKLETAEISDLGQCSKFIARRDESIMVEPKGSKKQIKDAISGLLEAANLEQNEDRKKTILKRVAMFQNTLAVIKVGAPTESEKKQIRFKVEDCVNAVKVAYKGGVVCGSGLALSQIETESDILNAALKEPFKQLKNNMGIEEHRQLKQDEAINVVTGQIGHFMKVGVVDPVDVLIAQVESAVSIASLLVTTSGMIVEQPKKPKIED